MRSRRTLTLLATLSLGCGVAAGPLSSRGATMDMGAVTGSQSAWFRCGRARYPDATSLTEVARYGRCSIVLAATRDDVETKRGVPLWLGPVEQLGKTDPAVLVKALARYDVLHVVLRWNERPRDASNTEARMAGEVACRSRGMAHDFDCRPEAIAALLADEDFSAVELWNRHWVRWR